MHGLILAGGEGSRLSREGVATPKALIRVGGKPQLARLVETFTGLGCETITCLLRESVPAPGFLLTNPLIRIIACETPGSLFTLALGFEAAPPGPVFCAMVDTVMATPDWHRVYGVTTSRLGAGADGVLVVTPRNDDDLPLAVRFDRRGQVAGFTDGGAPGDWVTGGVYAFAPTIRPLARRGIMAGHQRLRRFLAWLLTLGARLETVEVGRIVDLDRRRDLERAESLIAADGGG